MPELKSIYLEKQLHFEILATLMLSWMSEAPAANLAELRSGISPPSSWYSMWGFGIHKPEDQVLKNKWHFVQWLSVHLRNIAWQTLWPILHAKGLCIVWEIESQVHLLSENIPIILHWVQASLGCLKVHTILFHKGIPLCTRYLSKELIV